MTVVIWELSGTGEDRQRRGLRLIGYAFAGLAVYLLVQSTVVLAAGYHPRHSVLGIVWTAVTALAIYLGWLISWGAPLTLLGETPEQVAEVQRELVRIGIDRPRAAADGGPAVWAAGQPLRSYPVADFAGLAAVRHHRPVTVLDVRRDSEWNASHIDGAVHLPLHDLPGRIAELPGGDLWVHCGAG